MQSSLPALLSALIALIGLAPSSRAAEDTLAPITVIGTVDGSSGTGSARTGEVVLDEHTGSHQRIGPERLQAPGASLARVLGTAASVQVREAGAEGSYSTMSLRAASAAQTPVYWDGVPLTGAARPTLNLSELELLNIDTVDLYRGSTPVQLGGGGIGGAVNLRSPDDAGAHSAARLQTGSFGSRAIQLGAARGDADTHWQALLSTRRADNDFAYDDDNATPFNPADDSRQRRNNAQMQRDSLLLRLRRRLAEDREWDISLLHNDRDQGVPHWRNHADNRASYATTGTLLNLNARAQGMGGGDWNAKLGLSQQWHRSTYDDRESQVGLGAQYIRSRARDSGMQLYAEHLGEHGTTALHAELRHEVYHQQSQSTDSGRARRDSLALNAQWSGFSEDERWLLTPGITLGALRDRLDEELGAPAPDRDDRWAGLRIGVQREIDDTWKLSANLGQQQRQPGFFELFGDRGLALGNPELRPESSLNAELALRGESERGQLSLALFVSERDDLILPVFDARGVGRSENIGDARVTGIELNADVALGEYWRAALATTLQDAQNLAPQAAFNGKRLPGMSEFRLAGRLERPFGPNHLWLALEHQRGRYYDTANLLPAEDPWLLDAGADFPFGEWQLSIAFRNLGDEVAEDFNGYPKPGRSLHIGLRWRINHP